MRDVKIEVFAVMKKKRACGRGQGWSQTKNWLKNRRAYRLLGFPTRWIQIRINFSSLRCSSGDMRGLTQICTEIKADWEHRRRTNHTAVRYMTPCSIFITFYHLRRRCDPVSCEFSYHMAFIDSAKCDEFDIIYRIGHAKSQEITNCSLFGLVLRVFRILLRASRIISDLLHTHRSASSAR